MGKKRKSLQKLTELKRTKDLDSFLDEEPRLSEKEITKFFLNKLNTTDPIDSPEEFQNTGIMFLHYCNRIGREEQIFEQKNALYEFNHDLIMNQISNYLFKNGMMPRVSDIRDKTGISRTTIYKHLEDEKINGRNNKARKQLRMLVSQAMATLYKIGVEDRNAQALKYFINFVEPETNSGTVNNYVQINNIRLTQNDLENIPLEEQEKIETILLPFKKLKSTEIENQQVTG